MGRSTFPRVLAFAALVALGTGAAFAVDTPSPATPRANGGDPTTEPDRNVQRNKNAVTAATGSTTGQTLRPMPPSPGSNTPVTQPEGGVESNKNPLEPPR